MTVLSAEQFVYGRVEAKYSPRRAGGYQLVYWSDGLSNEMREELVTQVHGFRSEKDGRRRVQFFNSSDGRFVLVNTTPIAPHREIVDSAGRPGAFLCHGLVLTDRALASVENDPFRILDAFEFLDDGEAMVSRLGTGGGVVGGLEIQVPATEPRRPVLTWEPQRIVGWIELARHASDLLESGKRAWIHGASEHVEEALRLALFYTESERRTRCRFDTLAEQRDVAAGTCWALGSSRSTSDNGCIAVDASTGRLGGRRPEIQPDLYSSWLATTIPKELPPHSVARGVQRIAGWMADEELPDAGLVQVEDEAARAFVDVHANVVRKRLIKGVMKWLDESLAMRFIRAVEGGLIPSDLVEWSVDVELRKTCRAAREWLRADPDLSSRDWRQLRRLAVEAEDDVVFMISAVGSGRLASRERRAVLERISTEDFSLLKGCLVGRRAVLACRRFAGRLLDGATLESMDRNEFVDLLEAIVRNEAVSSLEKAEARTKLEELDLDESEESMLLARRLREVAGRLPKRSRFRGALEVRIAGVPVAGRWLAMTKRVGKQR